MVAPTNKETNSGTREMLSTLLHSSMNLAMRNHRSLECCADCLHCKDTTFRVVSNNDCISNQEIEKQMFVVKSAKRQPIPLIRFHVPSRR
jgi:hypothetical protein